jgi:phosphoenolpyruvate synthase/pyruvate phosphate dikinase
VGDVHSRPLAELRQADGALFGGKSASLGELIGAEIPVPPGFALSTTAFHAFVDEAGLRGEIESALARVSPDELAAARAASGAIGELLRSAAVPEAVREEVERRYGELAADREPPVAVRSSALGEDSEEATFAGQQETFLWVRGVDGVCDAVRDCWVSLYSPEALSYRAHLGGGEPPAMGVTVQLMVDAEISGVMFTCNPLSGDPSMVAVNASWGLGLAVVGGEVTPDDYLVSKVTREVVRQTISAKTLQYVAGEGGRGAVQVDVPAERREEPCLDAGRLAELVAVARRVEGHFGGHQDIEWAIADDGELFVVQSRPVTAMAKVPAVAPRGESAISLVMGKFGAGRS